MTTICTSGNPDYTLISAADIPEGALIVDKWVFGRGAALSVAFTRRVLEPLRRGGTLHDPNWGVRCRGDVYLGPGEPHALPVLTLHQS